MERQNSLLIRESSRHLLVGVLVSMRQVMSITLRFLLDVKCGEVIYLGFFLFQQGVRLGLCRNIHINE